MGTIALLYAFMYLQYTSYSKQFSYPNLYGEVGDEDEAVVSSSSSFFEEGKKTFFSRHTRQSAPTLATTCTT